MAVISQIIDYIRSSLVLDRGDQLLLLERLEGLDEVVVRVNGFGPAELACLVDAEGAAPCALEDPVFV